MKAKLNKNEMQNLTLEIYKQLCMDTDEKIIISAYAEKYTESQIDTAFKAAYDTFLQQTKPGYATKYRQALASYSLIVARCFHAMDWKTAKGALDSKVKLMQWLDENEE